MAPLPRPEARVNMDEMMAVLDDRAREACALSLSLSLSIDLSLSLSLSLSLRVKNGHYQMTDCGSPQNL